MREKEKLTSILIPESTRSELKLAMRKHGLLTYKELFDFLLILSDEKSKSTDETKTL